MGKKTRGNDELTKREVSYFLCKISQPSMELVPSVALPMFCIPTYCPALAGERMYIH